MSTEIDWFLRHNWIVQQPQPVINGNEHQKDIRGTNTLFNDGNGWELTIAVYVIYCLFPEWWGIRVVMSIKLLNQTHTHTSFRANIHELYTHTLTHIWTMWYYYTIHGCSSVIPVTNWGFTIHFSHAQQSVKSKKRERSRVRDLHAPTQKCSTLRRPYRPKKKVSELVKFSTV